MSAIGLMPPSGRRDGYDAGQTKGLRSNCGRTKALNKDKARQPNRLARLDFQPLKATFGSAPAPLPRNIREPLDTAGRALLEQLSGKLCLRMTARDFPHIVNRLALTPTAPPPWSRTSTSS